MLTPADLVNPRRTSGYDHVNFHGPRSDRSAVRYRASSGTKSAGNPGWYGPTRKTPLEAAQDYCDHMNSRPPLTIEDIRNPKRASGFDHVATSHQRRTASGPVRYFADIYGPGAGRRPSWRGPSRSTPEQAAQDAVDHKNKQRGAYVIKLRTTGHGGGKKIPRPKMPAEIADMDKKVKEWTRIEYEKINAPNYIYLFGEKGDPTYVKVGESINPEGRPQGLQTGNPRDLVVLAYYEADQQRGADKVLHQQFAAHHTGNEWFFSHDEILSHFKLTREEFYAAIDYKPAPLARDANTREATA